MRLKLSLVLLLFSFWGEVYTRNADICCYAEEQRPVIEANYVEFETADEHKVFYFEYVPETFDPAKPSTLILALHGHGSDCGQIFNGVHNEYNATNDFAVSHNSVVVSPNYGSGTSWMGPEAEQDMLCIIADQKSKRRYDQVIVSGASMGGSSALTIFVLHPELFDGIVSMNGTANHLEYENFQDAISESFGGRKSEIPLLYKQRSAEYFPELFKDKPTAITIGSLDTVVQPDSVRRLALILQKIGCPVMLIERTDIGHMTPYDEAMKAFEFVFKELANKSNK